MSLLCFGHRGAAGHAPENTLRAIERGIELGADWIEIDVQISADGVPVVFHDRLLDARTGAHGRVADHPLAFLRGLDVGDGETMPTLEEAFGMAAGRAGLNVEIKDADATDAVAAVVARWLERPPWSPGQVLVSSFNHHALRRFRRLLQAVPVGALTAELPLDYAAFATVLDAWSVHASLECVDRAFVDDAHRRGLRLFVYTVNHPDDIAWLRNLGVDGVFSDFPERVRAAR